MVSDFRRAFPGLCSRNVVRSSLCRPPTPHSSLLRTSAKMPLTFWVINSVCLFEPAFTRQTKVGKLVLANSSWCVWTAQKQSANTFLFGANSLQTCLMPGFVPFTHTNLGLPTRVCQLKDVRAHCYCASLVRTLYSVARHVFQARAPSRNSTKYRADDLCGNLISEYFCWMLGYPHFFSADHFLFWFFPLY